MGLCVGVRGRVNVYFTVSYDKSRDYSATRFYDLFSIILCLLYIVV